MISTVVRAMRLIDGWTKKRLLVSAGLAGVLSILEASALALVYLVLALLTDEAGVPHDRYPWLFGPFVRGSRDSELLQLAVVAIVLFVAKSIASAVIVRWQLWIQSACEARLASTLYAQYLAQDYLVHVTRNSAELMRNLTLSAGLMTTQVVGGLALLMTDGAILVGIFVTLLLANTVVTASLCAYLAVVAVIYLALTRSIHRAAMRDQVLTEETVRIAQEAFSGIKSVKAFDGSAVLSKRHSDSRLELARVRAHLLFATRLPQFYLEICLVIGLAAGAVILLGQGGDAAFLALLAGAAMRSLPSVNRVLSALNGVRVAEASVRSIERSGVSRSELPAVEGEQAPLICRERIEFRSVDFTYPGSDRPALSSIELSVDAGSAVGIVGESGAGKSTMVDLLLGLVEPSSGEVRIDGTVLTAVDHPRWRRAVGYVPQETFITDGSIRDNVIFHRTASDEQVWAALERAQLADFVRSLPETLDTRVSERGARLSGGQRQRIGIARAVLHEPSVIVFDEATSSLDGQTEQAITATMEGLKGTVTTIAVTHRLSTVRHCDQIILLRDGRMAGRGGFDQLRDQNEEFATMVAHASMERSTAGVNSATARGTAHAANPSAPTRSGMD